MEQRIEKHIRIDALPDVVWSYLTEPDLIKTWMGDPGMNVQIITDWIVWQPILIKGFHHEPFENKGLVMQVEPGKLLQYSHLSSLSRLPDSIENYTVMTFHLKPEEAQTMLSIHIENFPTESIYRHLNFYWAGTLSILKQFMEHNVN